jgi:hypothetical protein
MKMHLEEMAGTPDPRNGFMSRPFPIENLQLPVIDPTVSYFSMTVRHSVDMGDFSSTRISVDLQSQGARIADGDQGQNQEELAEERGTLISVGMTIPKEISDPVLSMKEPDLSIRNEVPSQNPRHPTILEPLLGYKS